MTPKTIFGRTAFLAAALALVLTAASEASAACDDPAGPQVDWSAGCSLSSVDLRKSNLTGANLSGALLSNALMEGVNLSGANMTDANLSGAILDGADLTGAKLDGANWTDGRVCAGGSLGFCE